MLVKSHKYAFRNDKKPKNFLFSSSKLLPHVQRVMKARKNRFQAGGERDESEQ